MDSKLKKIKEVLLKATQLDDSKPDLWIDLAEEYFDISPTENIKEAIQFLDKALEIQPKLVNAILKKGQFYLIIGAEDQALIHFNECLALEPSNNKAWIDKKIVLARNGQLGDIRQLAEEIVNTFSTYHIGIELIERLIDADQLQTSEKLIFELDQLIGVDEDDLALITWLKIVQKINFEEWSDFSFDDNHRFVWLNFCLKSSLYSLESKPSDFDLMSKIGFIYLELDKIEKAEEIFDRLLNSQPQNGTNYYGRALVEFSKKIDKNDRLILDLTEIALELGVSSKKEETGIWYLRGMSYLALENFFEAKYCFEIGSELSPKSFFDEFLIQINESIESINKDWMKFENYYFSF